MGFNSGFKGLNSIKRSKSCPSYSSLHLECFVCGLHFLLTGIAFRLSFVRLVQPSAVGTPPAIFVIGCAEIWGYCSEPEWSN